MLLDLGLIDYEKSYRVQKDFVSLRKLGEIDDIIISAEHYSVFTVGRSGSVNNLLVDEKSLAEKGIKVLMVDRGGDITYHGPGQIVVYPVIDLKNHRRDLHRYLRMLEGAVINTLAKYRVEGSRVTGKTGVWTNGLKIASIGIGSTNWITYHGLSVNIGVDLEYFSMINPCGIRDCRMTSLDEVLGVAIDINEFRAELISIMAKMFGIYGKLNEKRDTGLACKTA